MEQQRDQLPGQAPEAGPRAHSTGARFSHCEGTWGPASGSPWLQGSSSPSRCTTPIPSRCDPATRPPTPTPTQQWSGARACLTQPTASCPLGPWTPEISGAQRGLCGVSWGLQTRPLIGDCACPGTEDCEQNRGSGSQGSLCRTTEPRQEPRGPRARPEAEGSQEHTDPEALVSGLAPPPSSPSLCLGPCLCRRQQ